jgi:hypothetical protein
LDARVLDYKTSPRVSTVGKSKIVNPPIQNNPKSKIVNPKSNDFHLLGKAIYADLT